MDTQKVSLIVPCYNEEAVLGASSLVYLTKALIEHYVYKITVQGWISIIILMTFFTGIIIFCLNIIATYIGRIFEQGQNRPIYWVREARNIDVGEITPVSADVELSKNIISKQPQRQ